MDGALLIETGQLVLAALGDLTLVDVGVAGVPLALVRSAESMAIKAAPVAAAEGAADDDDLAGALLLADAALRAGALTVPMPPAEAVDLLPLLTDEGLQADEIARLLPELPVLQETIELVLEELHDDSGDAY